MIRYVLGGVCAAALAALVACAGMGSLAARPAAMAGTWSGSGVQDPIGGTAPWLVRLILAPDGDGLISYSLGCGGRLVRLRSIGSAVVYREEIAYGADKCIGGGTVTMVRDGERVFWYWTGEGTAEPEISATAVLRRERS